MLKKVDYVRLKNHEREKNPYSWFSLLMHDRIK